MAGVKQTARPLSSEDLDSEDLGNVDASPSELEPMKEKIVLRSTLEGRRLLEV